MATRLMLPTVILLPWLMCGNHAFLYGSLGPVSPCPHIFSYDSYTVNSWSGVLVLQTEETSHNPTLHIFLDQPANLQWDWNGNMGTRYDKNFSFAQLTPGLRPSIVKLSATYPEPRFRPNIDSITVSGKQICPAEEGMNEVQPSTARSRRIKRTNDWVTPDFNLYNRSTTKTTPTRPSNAGDDGWFTPSFGPLVPTTTKPPVVTQTTTKRTTVPTTQPPSPQPDIDIRFPGADSCGIPASQSQSALIWNGQDTTRGQFPWHAALYQSVGLAPNPTYLCGASLVTRRSLVTAAHCVSAHLTGVPADPATMVVYLGKSELSLRSENGAQIKQVSQLVTHPRYNATSYYADLAVIVLTSRVEYTFFVLPVCLWALSFTDLSHVEGRTGSVVGWGLGEEGKLTTDLKLANMPVVSQNTCLRSEEFYLHFTSDLTYCAGYRNGTSPCNGDSGGGMVFPEKLSDGTFRWSLRGVVSITKPVRYGNTCDPNKYIVFTDVAKCLPFIAASIVD